MKYSNIESLLVKYEQGNCSEEEVNLVETFLNEQDNPEISGYSEFISSEQNHKVTLDVLDIINSGASNTDMETSLQDSEEILNNALYQSFIEEEKNQSINLDVADLINQYEAIPDNIDELLEIQEASIPSEYSNFIKLESSIKSKINTSKAIEETEEEGAVIVPMKNRSTWKRLSGIAAIFILALSAIFLLRQNTASDMPVLAEVNGVEITDPDEALAYTLSILNKTSVNMKRGTDNMKVLNQLEHTQIYK